MLNDFSCHQCLYQFYMLFYIFIPFIVFKCVIISDLMPLKFSDLQLLSACFWNLLHLYWTSLQQSPDAISHTWLRISYLELPACFALACLFILLKVG